MLPPGGSVAVCMERLKGVSAPSSLAKMHAGIKLALLMRKSLVCSFTQHHQSDFIHYSLASLTGFDTKRCSMPIRS